MQSLSTDDFWPLLFAVRSIDHSLDPHGAELNSLSISDDDRTEIMGHFDRAVELAQSVLIKRADLNTTSHGLPYTNQSADELFYECQVQAGLYKDYATKYSTVGNAIPDAEDRLIALEKALITVASANSFSSLAASCSVTLPENFNVDNYGEDKVKEYARYVANKVKGYSEDGLGTFPPSVDVAHSSESSEDLQLEAHMREVRGADSLYRTRLQAYENIANLCEGSAICEHLAEKITKVRDQGSRVLMYVSGADESENGIKYRNRGLGVVTDENFEEVAEAYEELRVEVFAEIRDAEELPIDTRREMLNDYNVMTHIVNSSDTILIRDEEIPPLDTKRGKKFIEALQIRVNKLVQEHTQPINTRLSIDAHGKTYKDRVSPSSSTLIDEPVSGTATSAPHIEATTYHIIAPPISDSPRTDPNFSGTLSTPPEDNVDKVRPKGKETVNSASGFGYGRTMGGNQEAS